MSTQKETLKYLFVAEFADGTFFKQTSDDTSSLDPKKSQFYDVLQSEKSVHRFSLVGEGNTIAVDLVTGTFYINGLNVLLESEQLPTLPDKFELIFYRRWTRSLNVTYSTENREVSNTEALPSHCEYFIGWKCNIAGKSYQEKLAVK